MNLRKFIFISGFATVVSLVGLLLVLFFVNLADYGVWALLLFYAMLFLTVFGLAIIVGFYWFYRIRKVNESIQRICLYAIKNGAWFGTVLLLAVFLQSQRLLNWLVLCALLSLFVFVKIVFLNNSKNKI
ncbi:MAG: hypothetical protein WCT18_04670 [Patescibacteria group bacterium]